MLIRAYEYSFKGKLYNFIVHVLNLIDIYVIVIQIKPSHQQICLRRTLSKPTHNQTLM